MTTPHSATFQETFKLALMAKCEELAKKQQMVCEELTEKQIADALRQAILSGDFQKIVRPDGAQTVYYLPYMGIEELREENKNLKEKLQAIRESVMELQGAMTGRQGVMSDVWFHDHYQDRALIEGGEAELARLEAILQKALPDCDDAGEIIRAAWWGLKERKRQAAVNRNIEGMLRDQGRRP